MPEITLSFDHAKNGGPGRAKFRRSSSFRGPLGKRQRLERLDNRGQRSHNWKDEVHHRAVDPVTEQAYDIYTTEHLQ